MDSSTGVACSYSASDRGYIVFVVGVVCAYSMFGVARRTLVGVVCAYSMFGVARRTLVRSCASGLQYWSCLFTSASNRG